MKPYFWPVLILLSIAGSAQQVPQITDAQRAEFFKAKANMADAMAIPPVAAANAKYQEAVSKMQETCGSTSTLQMSPTGDPVCIAKQAAKPEPAKKP
jgi:hypothetical protein